LDRLAELGHLERLSFEAEVGRDPSILPDFMERLPTALNRGIKGNPKLTNLTLKHDTDLFDWTPYVGQIFKAMEDHTGLRTVILMPRTIRPSFFSSLERLLSRNRNITVLNKAGKRISNGTTVDALYALKRFLNGSVALLKETPVLRPLLVAAALTQRDRFRSSLYKRRIPLGSPLPLRARFYFQYAAQFLSDHVDIVASSSVVWI
jgi:hypothetical protein